MLFPDVLYAAPVSVGATAYVAARLTTPDGPAFLKVVRGHRAGMELRVQPHLPDIAPRLIHGEETGAEAVMVFEWVEGRPADLSPGSPDLDAVHEAISGLSRTHRPHLPVAPIGKRWGHLGLDLSSLRGTTLLHMDLCRENLLITGQGVRIVDWGWPSVGAPWLDAAAMVVRLIQAGHTVGQAEEWAASVPAWSEATGEALGVYLRAREAIIRKGGIGTPLHKAFSVWAEARDIG